MELITDIKSILKSSGVLAVLAESVWNPTEERLANRAGKYKNNNKVVAYGYEEDSRILGLIILDISIEKEIVILDIALNKATQHMGIGKKLIEHSLSTLKPNILIAETDDDAVDFYRRCGFIINCLGEKYANIVRYECKKILFNKRWILRGIIL